MKLWENRQKTEDEREGKRRNIETKESIESFIRKNETSHKSRKFQAFSELFLALFIKILKMFIISWTWKQLSLTNWGSTTDLSILVGSKGYWRLVAKILPYYRVKTTSWCRVMAKIICCTGSTKTFNVL